MARAPRSRRRAPAETVTTVLLVRHGTTGTTGKVLPGRASGLHLSDKGAAQAEAAAERIAPLSPTAVYSSPLERARETAAPIAKAAGLRTRRSRALLECDFGEWTGRELAELRKLSEWREVQSSPSVFRFPGGESFAEMQARMWQEVLRLTALHAGGVVVAVSHADPIKSVVAMAAGTGLDSLQRIVVSPCSITSVVLGIGPPMLLTVNSTGDDLSELTAS